MAITSSVLFVFSTVTLVVGTSDAWWSSVMFGIFSAYWCREFISARGDERRGRLARRAAPPPA
ncbi:hypothetical protein [Auraticoccus monumenti]|uniref:Uncharacterized protein n=1 Tax=Auraticoccus monumenti TaxID=675864 RepID=A0A1G6Z6T9_9ACTN|nr:hypothetical protein [Auraticoccus monumenti]SDD98348.1 hypothetical protein SAMN04489747_2207 [Auraticoccus monumenti]